MRPRKHEACSTARDDGDLRISALSEGCLPHLLRRWMRWVRRPSLPARYTDEVVLSKNVGTSEHAIARNDGGRRILLTDLPSWSSTAPTVAMGALVPSSIALRSAYNRVRDLDKLDIPLHSLERQARKTHLREKEICILLSKLYHSNAHPPLGARGAERGASPRGCSNSSPTHTQRKAKKAKQKSASLHRNFNLSR